MLLIKKFFYFIFSDFEPEVKPDLNLELHEDVDQEKLDNSIEILSAKKILYNCNQCQKTFEHKKSLIKHMEAHGGINLYKCQKCKIYFPKFDMLLTHLQSVHKEKPNHKSAIKKKQFQCHFCEEAFDQVSVLLNHEALHKGEESYKCKKCQSSFSQKTDFSKHIEECLVEGISYLCEDCPEAFVKKTGLLRHMCEHEVSSFNKNTKEQNRSKKDFKCSKCPESFISKNQLQEHLEVHAGVRPFKCTECDKAFKRKFDLKHHTSSYHAKNKKKITCKCHLCGNTFSYSFSLLRHHTKGDCMSVL